MYRWILILLMVLAVPAMAQIQEPGGGVGGADADSIVGIPVEDTTGNLADNDVMRYDLGSNSWKHEAPPGAGGGETNTLADSGTFDDASGFGWTQTKVGVELRIRGIMEGTGITIAKAGAGVNDTGLVVTADLGTAVDGSELDAGLKDSITDGQTAYGWGDHSSQNYLDNDDANVDTANWITAYTHSQATGNQHSIKLNEVNDLDGDKTFSMGAFGLNFTFANPSSNGLELNFTGVFTGEGLHVHQHTGNVGVTSLVTFEADDVDVMPLRVIHGGPRDTLSIFSGGLSQFDSVDVNGALRVDGTITTPNLVLNTDANIAVDAVQDSSIANDITIDHATETDSAGKAYQVQRDMDGDSIDVSAYLTATGVVVSDSNAASADSAGKALFAQQDADGDSIDVSLLAPIASPTFTGVVTIPDFLLTTGGADAAYDPTDAPADGDQLTWNTGGLTDWQPAAGGAGEANVLADTGTFDEVSGFGLTQTKAGVELRIRGFIEGNNITITKAGTGVNDTALIITAAAGSGVWTERSDSLFAVDADGDTVAVFWDDDAGNVRWQVATEDQTLRALLDTLGLGGDVISELAGTGLTVVSNELTVDLGTEIDTLEITDAQWQEYIPDWAGSMFTGNTETGIVATYQDADNTVDLVITAVSGLVIDGNNALVVKPGTGLDTTGGTVFMDMTTDSTGTGNLARADSPTFTTDITVPANSISDEELDEGASFIWTAVHDFGGATSLEIPNNDNPTTDANGEIAADNNSNALEVYIPLESESGLISFYKQLSIPIVLPDSVQAYAPDLKVWQVNALVHPFGIEIDSVSIQLDADAAYSMVLEEWSGADPPVKQNDISTVTTGGTDTYAAEAPDTDAAIDAGDWIVLNIPTTDVPVVTVGIIYHVTEGN